MKKRLFLLLLLVLAGVGMGINIAKDKPLFSNPFADKELRERASQTASQVVEESREVLDKTFTRD